MSIALLESFYNSGKPIALVCHSPGVLRHVMYKGEPLVKGKQVTSRKRRAAGMLLPEETVALSDRARAVRIKLRDSGSDYMQEALTHEEQTSP